MLLLKNLLFTLIVPGAVGVYVPLFFAQGRAPASGAMLVLALVLLGIGASIYAWCVWDFAAFGRGTPAPIDAPKRLVIRGLYRYTRNPMYVGVLIVILGWAALFQSTGLLFYAIGVGAVFHLSSCCMRKLSSSASLAPSTTITAQRSVVGCRIFTAAMPPDISFDRIHASSNQTRRLP